MKNQGGGGSRRGPQSATHGSSMSTAPGSSLNADNGNQGGQTPKAENDASMKKKSKKTKYETEESPSAEVPVALSSETA